MIKFTEKGDRITFEVIVQPRAGKSQVVGQLDGALKLRIAAPPVEGQANDECVEFLAQILRLRRADVEIVSGTAGRRKVISVRRLNRATFVERLNPYLLAREATDRQR